VSDRLREAGTIVAHLRRALLDGSRDLSTVPGLIRRIIADGMWHERVDPPSARALGPFRSFDEFAGTAAAKGGLGSSVRQLRQLCQDDKEALDAIDQVTGHNQGQRTDLVNNINEVRPQGTSQAQALRRLRKDAPELHADVLAERLTAHAAMVKAGYRQKTVTVPVARPESVARALQKYMSADDIAKLIAMLVGAADLSANRGDGDR
jgi:hypothetical protein